MGFVVTSSATIVCAHGGRVTLVPRQATVTIQGAPVLRETDILGAPIVGCAQPPSASTKPCTLVAAVMPGGSAPGVSAVGLPVHLDAVTGVTDGVPPGTVMVVSAGQTTVRA